VFSEQLLQVAGPTITLAGLVWSYMDKTDKALVEKVIALPEVSRVECMPTSEGRGGPNHRDSRISGTSALL
jgi:hypothetical protein